MEEQMQIVFSEYKSAISEILGTSLVDVILYGSRARKDARPDSDYDIMILADITPEEVSKYADQIYDMTYDFEMKYGMEINPNVQSLAVFKQWRKVYPFFINIDKEGIIV